MEDFETFPAEDVPLTGKKPPTPTISREYEGSGVDRNEMDN